MPRTAKTPISAKPEVGFDLLTLSVDTEFGTVVFQEPNYIADLKFERYYASLLPNGGDKVDWSQRTTGNAMAIAVIKTYAIEAPDLEWEKLPYRYQASLQKAAEEFFAWLTKLRGTPSPEDSKSDEEVREGEE